MMLIYRFLFVVLIMLLSSCQTLQDALTPGQESLATETPVVSECFFDGYGIGDPFPTYTGPSGPFDIEETGEWVQGIGHPVLAMSEDRYQVVLESGQSGWVDQRFGQLSGECESVPFVQTRPPAPDDICTLLFDVNREFLLVADANAGSDNVIGVIPVGEYHQILATGNANSSEALKLRLSTGEEGWLFIPTQVLFYSSTIQGACEDIPEEEIVDPDSMG